MTTADATLVKVLALTSILGTGGAAQAGTSSVEPAEGVASRATRPALSATPATLPPYSLPWQLRPVSTGNLVRLDSAAAAFNDAAGNLDVAVTTVLAASYQLTPDWAPTVRVGFVGNNAPGAALDGSSLVNPIVGATHVRSLGSYRLALFGAATIPIGTGSGDARYAPAAKTNAAAMTARPADAAMFAVNYTAGIVGGDLAYVNHGFTAQVEAMLLQYVRVRDGNGADAPDPLRTQASVGVHLGYFIGSHFSLSGELYHQRWLAHPTNLASRSMTSVAGGPRAHFRLGKHAWIRPGLSVVRGLDSRGFDAPLLTAQTTAIQIDVPVTF
jgi:hypothetical protein